MSALLVKQAVPEIHCRTADGVRPDVRAARRPGQDGVGLALLPWALLLSQAQTTPPGA